jgi:DNA-binding response OmpR family regulator
MQVLLVEHQAPLTKTIKSGLEKEDIDVRVVKNDLDAHAEAVTNPYDAILVDSQIPKMGGASLIRDLRQAEIVSPIIMLLRSRATGDRIDSLNAGADNCLSVPFVFAELLALLNVLQRRKRLPVRVGDLEIDTVGRTVRRSGRVIKLTPREFDLLELLAHNRGQVVTRTAIQQKFYGRGERIFSNVIPVYINFLRNKIDKGFETPLILTRWGEGYMLRPSE